MVWEDEMLEAEKTMQLINKFLLAENEIDFIFITHYTLNFSVK